MKNRLLITSLLFAAGALSAEDLSVKQTALDASEWNWNEIFNWDGGTTLEGSNLTIKGTLFADNTGTIGSALTAGTLTYDINSTSQSKTLLSGNTTFDSIVFNNGNIEIDSQTRTNILKVKGDVIVNSLQNVLINNGDARLEFGQRQKQGRVHNTWRGHFGRIEYEGSRRRGRRKCRSLPLRAVLHGYRRRRYYQEPQDNRKMGRQSHSLQCRQKLVVG